MTLNCYKTLVRSYIILTIPSGCDRERALRTSIFDCSRKILYIVIVTET